MLKSLILGGSLLTVLMVGGLPATASSVTNASRSTVAQTNTPEAATPVEVTPEAIERFANAYKAMAVIRQEAETEMVAAVEAEGLTLEEFNEIAQTQQSPEAAAAANVPEESMQQFANAVDEIVTIQEEAQVNMQSAIEAEGMAVEEFNAIYAQAQQDPSLQQQISEQLTQ